MSIVASLREKTAQYHECPEGTLCHAVLSEWEAQSVPCGHPFVVRSFISFPSTYMKMLLPSEGRKYVVGYIRVSNLEKQEMSLAHQLDTINRCHASMMESGQQYPLKIMVDAGGTTDHRPAFHELMQLLKTEDVGCIITANISRLSRNPQELEKVLHAMEKKMLSDRTKRGLAASRLKKMKNSSGTSQNRHHE